MWLQKDKTIPIEIREPLIKLFYKKSQHIEYLKKGITLKDIARGYIGYVINSNYSRGFGIVNYDEPKKYGIVIDRLKINIRKLANFLH